MLFSARLSLRGISKRNISLLKLLSTTPKTFQQDDTTTSRIAQANLASLLVPSNMAWGGSLDDVKDLIVYEDNHLLVMYKPCTVLMQGDNHGDDNLLDAAKRYLCKKYVKVGRAYLGLVHRIDRNTSGVVVFSKTSKSAARMSELFKTRNVTKYYMCVVNGNVLHDCGECHNLLVKTNKEKTAVIDINSKRKDAVAGILRYKVLHRISHSINQQDNEVKKQQTLLAIELETGRKHQIRAQLAHMGHPIVGDIKYGAPQRLKTREIALHSAVLSFLHPVDSDRHTFIGQVPKSWESRFGLSTVKAGKKFTNFALNHLLETPNVGTVSNKALNNRGLEINRHSNVKSFKELFFEATEDNDNDKVSNSTNNSTKIDHVKGQGAR